MKPFLRVLASISAVRDKARARNLIPDDTNSSPYDQRQGEYTAMTEEQPVLLHFSAGVLRTRSGGVTLVEVLVTLAVIGIVATQVVPGFRQVLANDRQTSVVNRFIASVLLARSIAATHGVQAVICPSADGVSCVDNDSWSGGWLVLRSSTAKDTPLETGDYTPVHREHATLPVVLISNRVMFRFRPRGKRATNGTAVFCTPQATKPRAVIISYNGRPRSSDVMAGGGAITCPAV